MDWIEQAITAPLNKQMVWFDVQEKPLLSKWDIVGGMTGHKSAFGEGVVYEQTVGTVTLFF
jgi:hypothetical protein